MQNSEIKGNGKSKNIYSRDMPDTYEEFKNKVERGNMPCDIQTNFLGYNTLGTPLNKSTLLKETTANKFGLTGDNAVPDDCLSLLGNMYKDVGVNSSTNGTVRYVKTNWGTNLVISDENRPNSPHGLIIVSHTKVFIVWVAGGTGSKGANLRAIYGTQTTETATYDENTKKLTFNMGSTTNATITYIGV